MKNLKVKMSLLALVLGASAAFATVQHHQSTDRKWSLDETSGVYTEVTGQLEGIDYTCSESQDVCTETYPAAVDPNNNPEGPNHVAPISSESGLFQ
jgi:hypothetical protein